MNGTHTRTWLAGMAGALAATVVLHLVTVAAAGALPVRLSDRDFWTLVGDLSEPNGTFNSDNLLSNESRLQYVIPSLVDTVKPGGAYLGVGPEQNFTYIFAVKPAMAFILDVRRGNLQLHLLYKALFELSADRADFVSRLFGRRRPDGLRRTSTAAEIFSAYLMEEPSPTQYDETLKAVTTVLVGRHGFNLSAEDLKGIEYVSKAFYTFGPAIRYSSTEATAGSYQPTYADLMVATDQKGRSHGYLADEDAFAYIKDLQARNAIIPVVGDFAGPKALRGIGKYVRENNATVSAFYTSNVEQYLRLYRVWGAFCNNAATLPLDEASTFIRAGLGGRVARGTAMTAELVPMSAEVEYCGNLRR